VPTTTTKWRKEICQQLGLPVPSTSERRRKAKSLGEPNKIDVILGDHNCLFRALSKEITLSEDHHKKVCKLIVDFMMEKDSVFKDFLGTSPQSYIKASKMDKEKTWGTSNELFAFATMVSTAVMVFCRKQENQTEFAWAQFFPLGESYERMQEVRVYLINPGEHYNRVISVHPAVPREESWFNPPSNDN
jgi:hypothetical protein